MSIWERLKEFGPWSRARLERDLEREIQNHLVYEAQESGDHRALGNIALVKEDVREAWGWARLEQFARDIRFGLRQVLRNPLFSAIAIATLALGIGGVAAMFSAVDAVLIRPLPYADADRLVMIWDDLSKTDDRPKSFPAPAEWFEWRRLNTVFTDMASPNRARQRSPARRARAGPGAQGHWKSLERTGREAADRARVHEEEDVNGARVVVISYGLWQRRFGGSPDVLAARSYVNDNPYEVIGVMPRGFYFSSARYRHLDAGFVSCLDANEFRVARWASGGATEAGSDAGAGEEVDAALSLQVTAKDFRGPHPAS